ncbi:Uncharacterized protein ToN1_08320 [Aromatoleum petrolei]|nr:Uncharacterized protein ToN1_08320 [Aromatoleum petrolei]
MIANRMAAPAVASPSTWCYRPPVARERVSIPDRKTPLATSRRSRWQADRMPARGNKASKSDACSGRHTPDPLPHRPSARALPDTRVGIARLCDAGPLGIALTVSTTDSAFRQERPVPMQTPIHPALFLVHFPVPDRSRSVIPPRQAPMADIEGSTVAPSRIGRSATLTCDADFDNRS